MSVIQKIQEKYAKLMAIIIALALIIFVIMLAFENGGSLFQGGNATTVGKVNGKKIDYTEFDKLIEQQERYMTSQGYPSSAASRQQANDAAWQQQVNLLLLTSEFDKLGFSIGKKELGDILYGKNAPEDLKRGFTDSTGFFNAQQAKMQIDQMLKGTPEQREQVNTYINSLETMRLNEKYNSLLLNSSNEPKWLLEKQNSDNSQLARISFVREVYTSIPDSSVKISDKEIEDYISKHKSEFKQEENRSIAYVAFSALPTASDSAAALAKINERKAEFDTTSQTGELIARYGSAIPYSDVYFPKSQLQQANMQMGTTYKDTIFSLPKNAVYGPYMDAGNYVLAKMLDSKILPDSVKCRHVLVSTNIQEGGVEDSVASRRIDSIERAIKGGASWDAMVQQYNPASDGSRQSKGEMTFPSTQIQDVNFAPEFAKFILFDGKPGDRKKVKTSFGWHYIEIMAFIKPEVHYKIAYLAQPIEVSPETDNNANNEATQFAGNSRNQKSFDENVEKLKPRGIFKRIEPNILPTAYQLQGLSGISRPFIKAIYDADRGDVIGPERVGDDYVVAIVTEVNEKGTQSAATARFNIEPLLRNHKKAEMIAQKLKAATTLEAAAAALGGKPIESADSIRLGNTTSSSISYEPKVIGAAFNIANKGKISAPIEGTSGVYVVRVDDITATANLEGNVADQRKLKYQQIKMRGLYPPPPQVLAENADIKDYRRKFY